MGTAILITNGDMGGTAGDATLILRRARAMYSEKSLFTRIILLNPRKQGTINVGDYYYSIERCENKKQLKTILLEINPEYLILYGDKIQMMTRQLHRFIMEKGMNTKVIVDIQGAVEEKKEYSSNFIRKYLIYPISCLNFKFAVNNADGAFVVSDEIAEKCEENCKHKGKLQYYKVRCGTEKVFSYDEILSYRRMFRNDKGIDNECVVFCYSGYRAGWQKVDEIVEHFKRFDRRINNAYFAFFCNSDTEFEKCLSEAFPKGNYSVELLKPEKYFQCLCGCDVGYILRDYNETNRVAFPNKFSDYLTSGLIVALNNALPEPMRLIHSYNCHYIDTDHVDLDEAIKSINFRNKNYEEFVNESIAICEKELLYTAQIKKSEL